MRRTSRPRSDRKRWFVFILTDQVELTSNISYPRTPKYSNQLRRRTAIVTDWDDIAQWAFFVLPDGAKDIYQIVCRAPP
jgi:hypothetical protein